LFTCAQAWQSQCEEEGSKGTTTPTPPPPPKSALAEQIEKVFADLKDKTDIADDVVLGASDSGNESSSDEASKLSMP
jgi:hypothetical protein